MTSSTVREPIDNLALSNAIRPGVVGWAKSLARELGPKGITVNCLAPGRIDTDRIREVYPDGPSEDDLAAIPLRRLGTTREVGDVVAFLCSERASYVSGTVDARRRRVSREASSSLKRFSGAAVVLGLLGLATALVLWWIAGERLPPRPGPRQAACRSRRGAGWQDERQGRRLLRRPLRPTDSPARAAAAVHAARRRDIRSRAGNRPGRDHRRGA